MWRRKGQSPAWFLTHLARFAWTTSPSWRGWDGKDFTVTFALPTGDQLRIRRLMFAHRFHTRTIPPESITTRRLIGLLRRDRTRAQARSDPKGSISRPRRTSFNWSKPALALTLNQMLRREPQGNWSYQYFSLIDPKSTNSSYMTITHGPYLYYVRLDGDRPHTSGSCFGKG